MNSVISYNDAMILARESVKEVIGVNGSDPIAVIFRYPEKNERNGGIQLSTLTPKDWVVLVKNDGTIKIINKGEIPWQYKQLK